MSASVTRLPVDPDLERAMRELAPVVTRLAALELTLADRKAPYRVYEHNLVMHGDAWGAIQARAEQLNLKPGSLRLFVEEHERLRAGQGRRPTLAQLQRAVLAANDLRARDRAARVAEEAIAAWRTKHAAEAAEAAEGAVTYLENCCG